MSVSPPERASGRADIFAILGCVAALAVVLVAALLIRREPGPVDHRALIERSAPIPASQPKNAGAEVVNEVPAAEPESTAPFERQMQPEFVVAAGRSPMPRLDEHIKLPVPAKRLSTGESLLRPDSPIPWYEAHKYVGQRVIVEGKVVHTGQSNKLVYLDFHEEWWRHFCIAILPTISGSWSDPAEVHFHNRTIRVNGVVTRPRQRPEMHVRDPLQITILH